MKIKRRNITAQPGKCKFIAVIVCVCVCTGAYIYVNCLYIGACGVGGNP